jgi:hypothetical protein
VDLAGTEGWGSRRGARCLLTGDQGDGGAIGAGRPGDRSAVLTDRRFGLEASAPVVLQVPDGDLDHAALGIARRAPRIPASSTAWAWSRRSSLARMRPMAGFAKSLKCRSCGGTAQGLHQATEEGTEVVGTFWRPELSWRQPGYCRRRGGHDGG